MSRECWDGERGTYNWYPETTQVYPDEIAREEIEHLSEEEIEERALCEVVFLLGDLKYMVSDNEDGAWNHSIPVVFDIMVRYEMAYVWRGLKVPDEIKECVEEALSIINSMR